MEVTYNGHVVHLTSISTHRGWKSIKNTGQDNHSSEVCLSYQGLKLEWRVGLFCLLCTWRPPCPWIHSITRSCSLCSRHCLGGWNQSHRCRNRSQRPPPAPSSSGFLSSLFWLWHLPGMLMAPLWTVWYSPKLEEHSSLCVCLHRIKECVSAHGTPTGWWLPPADPISSLQVPV